MAKRKKGIKRIGIILAELGKLNVNALKYLVLQMNTHLQSFQFEFISSDLDHFTIFSSGQEIDWDAHENEVALNLDRFKREVNESRKGYELNGKLPDDFVLISLCKFKGGYYVQSSGKLAVFGLGNWDKTMAPPSILEMIVTLLIAIALDRTSPTFGDGGSHYETKGCLGDFTAYLSDARFMALTGFICAQCQAELKKDGMEYLIEEIQPILNRTWLGDRSIATSPAAITGKLGFDLFTTRGLTSSRRERIMRLLEEESVKQVLVIVAGVVLAALLIWFGLKDH